MNSYQVVFLGGCILIAGSKNGFRAVIGGIFIILSFTGS